jgi:hypothetical protein
MVLRFATPLVVGLESARELDLRQYPVDQPLGSLAGHVDLGAGRVAWRAGGGGGVGEAARAEDHGKFEGAKRLIAAIMWRLLR